MIVLSTGLLAIASLTSAQCTADDSSKKQACSESIVEINNQTALDFYSKCQVLDSLLFVKHCFTGDFELPGVKSAGKISSGWNGPNITERMDDPVTLISFPDLQNITSGLQMSYLNYLTNVSFPKVDTVVGDVVIMDNKGLKKLAFPSLKNITGGVLIHGSFDEISFPSLQSVGWMNVRPGLKFDCVSLGKNLSSLITTVKKESSLYDIGFTCQTGYAKNSWNSSDPKGNAQATEIPSSVTDGGSVPSTTPGAKSIATRSQLKYYTVATVLCGLFLFI